MVCTSILLGIFIILIAKFLWHSKRKYDAVKHLPGPTPIPIFGNIFDLGSTSTDVFTKLNHLTKSYGNVVRLFIGPTQLKILVSDPKYVEYIAANGNLDRTDFYGALDDWLHGGILITSGPLWKRQRKIFNQLFRRNVIDQYIETFKKHGNYVTETINVIVNQEVDVQDLCDEISLGISLETMISMDKDSDKNSKYSKAKQKILEIATKRFFSILMRNAFCFKFSYDYNEQKKAIKTTYDITYEQMAKKKIDFQNGIERSNKSLMDYILAVSDKDYVFTDDDIRTQLLTFTAAGAHTTATTLAVTIYEIAKNPEVQKGIVNEVNEMLEENSIEELTPNQVYELKYLDRVLKESMRKWPAIPYMERQITEDANIDGVKIPKGTIVATWIYGLHNSEDLYPNPEQFDPDRFLPENIAKRPAYSYVPFGYGQRNCIGRKYADLALKVLLVKVISNFEVTPANLEHKIEGGLEIAFKSMNGLPVIFRKRNK